MSLKRVQLIVHGRVQGVFFQAGSQREARRLGLTGVIRERRDGGLDLIAEGEEQSLHEFVAWNQRGPTTARVDKVEVKWRSYVGEYRDFRFMN